MFNWLRRMLLPEAEMAKPLAGAIDTRLPQPAIKPPPQDEPVNLRMDQLVVDVPEDGEFDKSACERLLATIIRSGVVMVDDVYGHVVSLEDYFEGNRSVARIASGKLLSSPLNNAAGWYELLQSIREVDGVDDVLVTIHMIEHDEDNRVRKWPYSDSIWIYSSLDQNSIAQLVAPLEPDEVQNAETDDPAFLLKAPVPVKKGSHAYWVCWD